jgi:hypothetical protein
MMLGGIFVAKRTKGIGECAWCKFNPYGCDNDTCDFRTLEFQKIDILERMKSEVKIIDDVKSRLYALGDDQPSEEEIGGMFDRVKALDIMSKALQSDFGMTEEEVKVQAGFDKKKKIKMGSKLRLITKLAKMKRQRGKK